MLGKATDASPCSSREGQAVAVAAGKRLRLARGSRRCQTGPTVWMTWRAGSAPARGDHGLARRAAGPRRARMRAALLEDGGAARAMDGAVDAAAAQEAGVGGVDDGVDALAREVATRDLQPPGADRRATGRDADARSGLRRSGEGREERAGAPRARRVGYLAPRAASLAALATTNFSRLRAGSSFPRRSGDCVPCAPCSCAPRASRRPGS